jgi:hypothetical protein
MMYITKMYDLPLIFLFLFLIIDCAIYYTILTFGSYFTFFITAILFITGKKQQETHDITKMDIIFF